VVTVAENGAMALQALADQSFDLVLMDVQMPVMDGYETTRRLRAIPALRSLPVVAMTAHAMDRDRQLCLAAGMNDFLGKPFLPRELFDVLARHLPWAVAAAPASTPPTRSSADAPSAVSWELGLHRCLGRKELHARILQRFLATRSDDATRLLAALHDGDTTSAELIAHTMVSTAGTIGADGLSTAARALQQALQDRADERVAALAPAFALEHARVLAALQSWADAVNLRPV
jgi:CheY-like chemotaxis protein